MKKGFTLIEMLAVIIVLGVMIAIFIPNVVKVVRENNLKVYKIKEKKMIKAAEEYSEFDKGFNPPGEGASYITINQLVSGNYMNKVLDSDSSNECSGYVKVTDNKVHGYDYEACLICDEYRSNNCSNSRSVEMTNIVKNPGFEMGMNDWTPIGSGHSITETRSLSGSKSAIRPVSSSGGTVYYRQELSFVNGHKYYYSVAVSTDSDTTQPFVSDVFNAGGGIVGSITKNEGWKRLSSIYSSAATENRFISVHYSPLDEIAYIDNVMMVDLTNAFGSGNEPNKAWCDSNIPFFEGTKTIVVLG